jgi:hypothetical protein
MSWQQPSGQGVHSGLQQQQQQQQAWPGSSLVSALLGAPAAAAAALHSWQQPRGRIVQVLDRLSVTSGRRIAAWGNLRATYIQFRLATHWYFGGSAEQLQELYRRLYTDSFR